MRIFQADNVMRKERKVWGAIFVIHVWTLGVQNNLVRDIFLWILFLQTEENMEYILSSRTLCFFMDIERAASEQTFPLLALL